MKLKYLIFVSIFTIATSYQCGNRVAGSNNYDTSDPIPQSKIDTYRAPIYKSGAYEKSSIPTDVTSTTVNLTTSCSPPQESVAVAKTYTCQINAAPGGKDISIHFQNFSTEENYDLVYLYNENNTLQAVYHGSLGDFWSEKIPGTKVFLRYVTDASVRSSGFKILEYALGSSETISAPPTPTWNNITVDYESQHGVTLFLGKTHTEKVTIKRSGATGLQLHFARVNVDALCLIPYDAGACKARVLVYDPNVSLTIPIKEFKRSLSNNYVRDYWLTGITGDTAIVEFKVTSGLITGPALNEYGFKIDKINVQSATSVSPYENKYPIVLHHGFAGWDSVLGYEYFFRVKKHLINNGFKVYVTEVSPFASLQTRTSQLKTQIDSILVQSGATKVNIIGHSMGGLDARLLLSPNTTGATSSSDPRDSVSGYNYGNKIATITTVATPHLGTRVADIATQIIPGNSAQVLSFFANMAASLYNQSPSQNDILDCMYNLSEKFTMQYNIDHVLPLAFRSNNRFITYAGETNPMFPIKSGQDEVNPFLVLTYNILKADSILAHKKNDGMVPTHSAVWDATYNRTYQGGNLKADHFDEIGQILGLTDPDFNHLDYYLYLARQIAINEVGL